MSEIFGITESNAIEIISEVVDMRKWQIKISLMVKLAPNNKISGGKILSSRIPKRKIGSKYLKWLLLQSEE
ncbi:MAG: transposase [Flavobacteriaceae bacterium]|nr:transposase [Flavobacteriaceae bacterium]